MSLTISSTTDSETDVKSALGDKQSLGDKPQAPQVKVEEQKPAVESASTEVDPVKPGEAKPLEEKPTNLDKRFAKLTRQRKEAEARAEDESRQRAYWENEAKKYRDVKPEKSLETKVETKPETDEEPNQDKFGTYQEFQKAWNKWNVRQEMKAMEETRERKLAEQTTKATMENKWKSYSEKEKAFANETPDFLTRIEAVKEAGIKMSPIVESRIIEAQSPELAYELMKDPDEFKALCEMNPNDALEHIGIVKAQLRAKSSGGKPETKVIEVKQPKPVSPVGSKVSAMKDPEKMSMKEYDLWRRAGNSPN